MKAPADPLPDNSVFNVPDKLYFRIGEVSRIAGVPASVLRFWESEFASIRPHRTDAGQRLYRRSDVDLILTIKHLLYDQKFTIKGARQYLKTKPKQTASQTPDPVSADDLVAMVRRELAQIKDLLN
jgi:DNA-binding transcriptional MerR regulator